MKYAQGPWKASYNSKFGQWSILHSGECKKGDTSKFAQVLTSLDEDADEANARLIAAAPELLQQVLEFRARLHISREVLDAAGIDVDAQLERVDAAIAKARGQ